MQQDNPHQSALLRCLSRLDVDIWAQVLLPKLLAQGSAEDVALTCSQLRDLCFGAVQHINLSSVQDNQQIHVEDCVMTIPQHFRNAKSVQLLFNGDPSYHRAPYLLTTLARLPKLEVIKLRVEGDPRPMSMGTVLYSFRTQLAGAVCSLHLDLQQSWAGAAQVWRELGKLTWLTQLVLKYGQDVAEPLGQQDLLPLANLHSMEELEINSANQDFFQPLLSAQLADGLTALTSLCLTGCPVSCLAHVSSCRALRELIMGCPDRLEEELSPREWAAVGELEGLFELRLHNAKLLAPSHDFCGAVSKLARLRCLGAGVWLTGMLPALATFTQLTRLEGGWQYGGSNVDGVVLPNVVELGCASGSPPFGALPNLVTVEQDSCLTIDAFASMTRHCTGLREINVSDVRTGLSSLPSNAPVHARVAAWTALTSLTGLTCLECMVAEQHELMAVVETVRSLLPTGFQRLRVLALTETPLSIKPLLLLGKLQGLPKLLLHLGSSLVSEILPDLPILLIALSGINSVVLKGLKERPGGYRCSGSGQP